MKSFFIDQNLKYELAPYFQVCCPILEEWHKAIESVILSSNNVSHGAVYEIIKCRIERIESLPSVQVTLSLMLFNAAALCSCLPVVDFFGKPQSIRIYTVTSNRFSYWLSKLVVINHTV